MKVLICYFSGTGNTERVVQEYAKVLTAQQHEVHLVAITDQTAPADLPAFDKFGLAYPIHAFNAPKIVLDFAKKLPRQANKQDLFIFKTSGEPLALNNCSSAKLVSILKKKNFVLTNEYHYVMPYNMIFRHSNAMAAKMWRTAQALIPLDCGEIFSGHTAKLKPVFLGRTIAWLFRIEHWGAKFNGRKYQVTDTCVHCQQCVKNCPTKNISCQDGKFTFGKNCLMCMRCSFLCPVDAFKIGWFNGWKVNGPYDFNDPDNTAQKKHQKWCQKSYQKYFARSEQKIAAATKQ